MSTTPGNPETNSSKQTPSQIAAKEPKPRPRLKTLLRRVALLLVILVLVGAASIGGAEYYTSKPEFCGSCHIMDPYYNSWSHDKHGAKLGVRCVDCHYAPGEKMTFHAKFKGLSQATSYFSGRYGAGRPRAHVSDSSCLNSGCHADREFMKKDFSIGEKHMEKRNIDDRQIEVERRPTVRFNHSKHLEVDGRLKETQAKLDELTKRLESSSSPDAMNRILAASLSVLPAEQRESVMRKLLTELNLKNSEPDAIALMRLEHTTTRLKQLEGLNCAGCHTYDASGNHHITVEKQTCFTCHFNNQEFNHETGECLKCHEPPVRRIAIHPVNTEGNTQSGMMDHRDIVARGINCASCHRDVVQGLASVTARDCTHCHDQGKYLKDFEARTTRTVEEYHRVHVAAQKAHCGDCHRSIEHHLIDATQVGSSSGLLQPVLNDCQHCHPSHHQEQVQLLMGVGGSGLDRAMPNAMFGSRINCQACHTKSAIDKKGDALVKATESACVACHSSDYERLFKQWREEMEHTLIETEKSVERVQKRVDEIRQSKGAIPARVLEIIEQAKHNAHFVRSGNGIHNKGYALQLLETSTRNLDDAMMMIAAK